MLQEADQPLLVDLVEERSDVGVQYEAHLLAVDSDTERIQRIVRATPRPEPIRDAEEVLLVDRVQQRDHSPLDNLVLRGRDREWPWPAIRLGYVHPPAWPHPIRSAWDPVVQIFEIALEICLVVLPHQPVHSRCRVHIEFVEHVLKKIDADVVEERDELLLLPFPCSVCAPAHVACWSGSVPRAWFAGPHFPWSPPLAPPAPLWLAPPRIAPQQAAPLCSPASQLLWRSPTSRARSSSATAPRLPDADRPSHATLMVRHETSQLPMR